jgi:hypothetical protein
LADGQTVKGLGPMAFDRRAVQACDGSCKIIFTGAGGRVQVNFFKTVWGDILMSKQAGVFVSGLVTRNGPQVTILLQDLH